LICVELFDLIH